MLRVKDHKLSEPQENIVAFTVSNKTQRDFRSLSKFNKNKRDRQIVMSRTRNDLVDPSHKKVMDRMKKMQKAAAARKKQDSIAATKSVVVVKKEATTTQLTK